MREEGFNPIPVFHYGSDFSYLDWYESKGEDFIALGGTVPIQDKKRVVDWINKCINRKPGVRFHVLGTNHKQILNTCTSLESVDSSTWIMAAANGYPKTIPGRDREAKIERAKANIRSIVGTGSIKWGR
ncbi:hypothetical protein [Paenibacillus senegalensis]|uniref:hypothetical protein n=1 Tax=Paenibacillus senegalensis TaxID=1465766 RepID=UPI0011DE2CF9|nr:hypothetical protein [Paenibacillus senegalensis]